MCYKNCRYKFYNRERDKLSNQSIYNFVLHTDFDLCSRPVIVNNTVYVQIYVIYYLIAAYIIFK